MAQEHRNSDDGSKQVPDPTLLTTQAILREISMLKELFFSEIRALSDRHQARFDGMDKAIDLIQQAANRVPTEVDLKVGNIRELFNNRLAAIDTQFFERDKRVEQLQRSDKSAVDTALQAQKESAAKVEEGFRREIETLSKLVDTKTEALRARLDTIQTFQARLGVGE